MLEKLPAELVVPESVAEAQSVIRAVVDAGFYYDDQAIWTLLSSVGERWP